MKTIIYIYVVKSSKDPDNVIAAVPFRVNEDEIFYGPCKKRLRAELRKNYLSEIIDYNKITDENVFIIGVNASNTKKIRKVIFVGRLEEVMTYEQAYKRLKDQKYIKMLSLAKSSPLHVKPIYENQQLIGYEYRSNGHHINNWQSDLTDKKNKINNNLSYIKIEKEESVWNIFNRDSCMLLKNIFWADKKSKFSSKPITGIDINENLLNLLQQVQPEKQIDNYAIFGYRKDGSADGKTGSYLKFDDEKSIEFIKLIKQEI